MGLPASSGLDLAARLAVEDRLRALRRGLFWPGRLADRPVAALVASAGLGLLLASSKGALLLLGALETIGRAQLPPEARLGAVLVIPRVLVSLTGATVLSGLGKLLAAAQTWVGLEGPGRPLDPEERAILRRVFGDALDLEPLRIKEGASGLFDLTSRPFVHGEVLYLKRWSATAPLLVHEAVHFWQSQHGGPDYMLDSLFSQAFGRGYDWRASVPGTAWRDLETEQQAQLIEDAYRAGYFEGRSFIAGEVDLGSVMEDVVEQLRSGRGAP